MLAHDAVHPDKPPSCVKRSPPGVEAGHGRHGQTVGKLRRRRGRLTLALGRDRPSLRRLGPLCSRSAKPASQGITPTVVKTMTAVTLKPAETHPVAYKLVVPGSNGKEYFLFENRQSISFDEGLQYFYRFSPDGDILSLPIHGMTVYHVDDCVFTLNYWLPNEAENWKEFRSEGRRKAPNGANHHAISVVQADDNWDLEHAGTGRPGRHISRVLERDEARQQDTAQHEQLLLLAG